MNFPFRSITRTAELERILALPRRQVQNSVLLSEMLAQLLRTDSGTMTLRPIQAQALWELVKCQGLFAPIRVGGGKTLISLLAPVLLESKRPLLMLPAKLIDKTEQERNALAQHWRLSPVRIISYELMGHERGQQELLEFAPDFIIADECHKLKNTKAAVTRRVSRYLAKNHNTRFLAMSGTITKRSIRDFWHIAKWCLGTNTPLPLKWPEMSLWADALDEKVPPLMRVKPGALLSLADGNSLAAVRRGFQKRLIETPGVISTTQSLSGPGLSFRRRSYEFSKELASAFNRLRGSWETPDGWPITDAVSLWRHARELACGFYYRWNPRPPEAWLYARRSWASYVRQVIHNRRYNLDTELQVAKACTDGRLLSDTYEQWRNTKERFDPNVEAVWLDDSALELAAKWLKQNPGIVWVEHIAFGKRLAELTGLSYFGAGGLSDDNTQIENASGPIIASISANAEGRNLQRWSQNLVVSCPPNGSTWEQLLGRTHRDGQQATEVSFDVLVVCDEQQKGLKQAIADARYIEETTGQPQKLIIGEEKWTTFFQESN